MPSGGRVGAGAHLRRPPERVGAGGAAGAVLACRAWAAALRRSLCSRAFTAACKGLATSKGLGSADGSVHPLQPAAPPAVSAGLLDTTVHVMGCGQGREAPTAPPTLHGRCSEQQQEAQHLHGDCRQSLDAWTERGGRELNPAPIPLACRVWPGFAAAGLDPTSNVCGWGVGMLPVHG